VSPSVVVIGTSLGGLNALQVLLPALPAGLPLPLVIVQHRGKDPDDALSRLLSAHCVLPVSEPVDKEALLPGRVYIAPAEYHLLVEPSNLALSTEAPVNCARPSVDVLFESAAESHGAGTIGVVLTGANQDGAVGAARIKQCGGVVVVQDPASAESRIMPAAAIAASGGKVMSLAQIGKFLGSLRDLKGDSSAWRR